ncbi:AAA family ATPase [Deinococcus soli (ex Cha et al. 2016)]|uniref:AAA family ATPase n=1 Tax=Deinococcus soli (ex Cha et al. 2016) TaxID=1309411 RepID=UPI003622EA5D
MTTYSSTERFHKPQGLTGPAAEVDVLRRLRRTLSSATVAIQSTSGTGKTILLSRLGEYLHSTEPSTMVGWMTVAPDDLDSRQFVRSTARALAFIGVGLRNYDEVATKAEAAPELAMIALADDVVAHPEDVALLIDDAEHLSDASAKLLWQFVAAAQDTLRVAVACTPDCAVTTIDRPERIGLAQFSAQDVMFGWRLPDEEEVRRALNALPSPLRCALTLAAPLPSWSDSGLRDLEINPGEQWLDVIQAAQLPILLQGSEVVPTALLRHQLLADLEADPQQYRRQQVLAGRRLAMQGRILEAVQALCAGHQYDEALPLVQEMLPVWYRRGDWRMITQALKPFPLSALPGTVLADLATARQDLGDAEALDAIEQHLAGREQPPGMSFVRALRAFREGQVPSAIAHCRDGLTRARTARDRIQLKRVLATGLIQQGDIQEASVHLQDALSLAETLGDVPMLINVLGLQGFHLEASGAHHAARDVHERAFGLIEQHRHDNNRLLIVAQRLSNLRRESGDLDGCYSILEVAMQRLQRTHPDALPILLAARGAAHLMTGQFNAALTDTQRAVSLAALWNGKSTMIDALFRLAEIQLVMGAIADAEATLARAYTAHDPFPANMVREYHAFQAALLARSGDLTGARDVLEQHNLTALSDWLDYGMMARAVAVLTAEPDCLPDAITALERAATARPAYALTRPLQMFPDLAAQLRGRMAADVDQLIRILPGTARRPTLRVTTLDSSRLTLDGAPLRPRSGTAELAAYLALAPGQAASSAQLAECVVQEGGRTPRPKRLRVNRKELEAAVAHARPGLPLLRVIDSEQGRDSRWRLACDVHIECDAVELLNTHDPETIMRLYRKPFLMELTTDWAEELRYELAAHATRHLRAAALGAGGQRALRYLLRVLEIRPFEPFDERFELDIKDALTLARSLDRPDIERLLRDAQDALAHGTQPVFAVADLA